MAQMYGQGDRVMIERSKDFRRIKRIGCWDDLLIGDDCYYLIEIEDGKDIGVHMFHPCDDGLMTHISFLDGHRGKVAAQSARNAFTWIFANTSFSILYAAIPIVNKSVHTLACAVGFEFIYCDDLNRYYSLKRPVIDMKAAV